ncbi:MAG: aminotransferase class I/II-fold pyridoxal phosphate-dependent enzyme, partial [Methanobacteriaceae archaeon]
MVVKINENYLLLENSYLFAEIAKRIENFQNENPSVEIIKMGIGDVTKPLPKSIITAFKNAVSEMASSETFRGYGPEQGYDFLRETIVKNDFKDNHFTDNQIDISIDEIFISDGAKCDCGNIQEIFGLDNVVAITDPVYPVYLDTNVMAGRTGKIGEDGKYKGLVYLPCTKENNFIPPLPKEDVDLIYLCFPNNPTGTTLTKDQLAVFVNYAKENKAIILFDAAYEAFISEDDVPHSIYEI